MLGRALAAGVWALSQAIIIYILALLGVRVSWDPVFLIGTLLVVILGVALFSTFSLIIACLVRTRERFMGIEQVLTMPRFFASNAIYPAMELLFCYSSRWSLGPDTGFCSYGVIHCKRRIFLVSWMHPWVR